MTVYLVGAGPGDPGLVTLRAASLLGRCDLLVHDRLVDPRVLAMVDPTATVVDVGKRPGSGEMTQQEINGLLVGKGRDGIVVRLKGGDPYVFGRGGEEALALAEAGVPYEVVPGLSSAFAVPAAAGVPVTLRGASSAVVVLTGHDPEHAHGLEELARSGATLVVLMGAATRAELADRLLAAGMDGATPVVATFAGTLPEQRSVRTTLGELGATPLESPVTIVIGTVASEQLVSFEQRPLMGHRVVVTRRPEQADRLSELLAEHGARPVQFPTIEVAPPPDGGAALRDALDRLDSFDWVVLASENAVEALFRPLRDARALAGRRVAAVGAATARALAVRGVVADLVATEAGSNGLVAAFPSPAGDEVVLLARAVAGLDRIEKGLRSLGYRVEAVAAYETRPPIASEEALASLAGCDAVVFASPSSVDNYLTLAGRERLGKIAVAIGPTTGARLSELGIAHVVAATPSPEAIVVALVDWAESNPVAEP